MSPSIETTTYDSGLLLYRMRSPINSTQDESRSMLAKIESLPKVVAVLADIQLNGRGTQGRSWERGIGSSGISDGNLYLTVCLPLDAVPSTITLLPLQVAVIVAQRLKKVLKNACGKLDPSLVRVKWPNDVLIADRKVSGTLIENEIVGGKTWMLIGIGVNVLTSPQSILGKRPAVSLQEHCAEQLPLETASVLGTDIAMALTDWLNESRTVDIDSSILQNWRGLADLGNLYELRGGVVDERGYEGEKVTVVDVEKDGRLRVRGEDGQTRLLTAEYLV